MKSGWFLIVACIGTGLVACAPSPNSAPTATATATQTADVTFQKDIAPILNRSCVSCHSGSSAAGELSMESLDQLMKGGEHGAVVSSGDAAASRLIKAVRHEPGIDPMPPSKKKKLPDEEIAKLESWVAGGAKP